jgi:hypothetical protein
MMAESIVEPLANRISIRISAVFIPVVPCSTRHSCDEDSASHEPLVPAVSVP